MRLILAVAFVLFAAHSPASAAPLTCQQALDLPEAKESAVDADEVGSAFGKGIFEIDGTTITSPALLKDALAYAKGGTLIVNGGDFSGWDFAKLDFTIANICFHTSQMKASRWDGGHFSNIGFVKSNLEGASFKGAKLPAILLREAGLAHVSMAGASLEKGLFDGGWGGSAENWDLSEADMRGFIFDCGITIGDGCTLDRTGVNFSGADLTDADISSFMLWNDGAYRGSRFANTIIAPRQIAEIDGIKIAGPVILSGGAEIMALDANEIALLHKQYLANAQVEGNPSYSCEKAVTAVEKLICDDYESELRRLDRQMAALYATIRPKNPGIAGAQSKWLKSRNACADRDCLYDRYVKRIAELQTELGEPEILKRGESALFIDMPISFPATFQQNPLFRKITPVLAGASMGEAVLTRAANGRYSIAGEAIGSNAHSCSVGGDAIGFDPVTGWFSGPSDEAPKGKAAVFRWFDDVIEFPGSGHPDEAFPGSDSYASCGMRATLQPMTRIVVSQSLLANRKAYLASDER